MAFKHGRLTLIDLDAGGDTKITSAEGQDIVFYPTDRYTFGLSKAQS